GRSVPGPLQPHWGDRRGEARYDRSSWSFRERRLRGGIGAPALAFQPPVAGFGNHFWLASLTMGQARPFNLHDSRPLGRMEEMHSTTDKLLGLELLRFASAM